MYVVGTIKIEDVDNKSIRHIKFSDANIFIKILNLIKSL
jgi:hypothetical protein